ncbi:MAG TPA: DUF3105 domain-containing protein [Solirubrobacteraceae bacterium]|jgi:hypothetical protein
MSSRQEEKEQRKRERLEREQAAEAAAKRKRLLQIGGGAVVAAVVVAGVVLAATGGGGGKNRASEADVTSAAKAAGCVYKAFPQEGRNHVTQKLTAADYKTNPPTSGNHNPTPAQDGLYPPGNAPAIENWVHTLEHGRILLMYKPGSAPANVSALQKLYEEPVLGSGKSYHMVLMQNNTNMPFQTAAVGWQHYVGCKDASPGSIVAMRKFRDRYVDKGPEFIP